MNRRGKPIECRITLSPLLGIDQQTAGVIPLIEERQD